MDYQKQGTDFLEKHGLDFRAVLVGSDCPTFCPDAEAQNDMESVEKFPRKTHIHGKHYRITIWRKEDKGGRFVVDYWNSYTDEEFNYVRTHASEVSYQTLDRVLGKRGYHDGAVGILLMRHKAKIPTPYDVFACLTKSDPGTLQDFCGDFGYDTDSKRHTAIYEAVCQEYKRIRKFFTPEEIEEMQEIQ